MTDQEIIDRLQDKLDQSEYYQDFDIVEATAYFERVLVRYTRWLERAKYDIFWREWMVINFRMD